MKKRSVPETADADKKTTPEALLLRIDFDKRFCISTPAGWHIYSHGFQPVVIISKNKPRHSKVTIDLHTPWRGRNE